MKFNQKTVAAEQNSEKATPIPSEKVPGIVPVQDGNLDNSELQNAEKPIPQVPEIQGLLQNKKTSCNDLQDVQEIKKWAVQDLLQNGGKSLFYRGLDDSADGRFPLGFPDCDKIELILFLIDSLNYEEKERLFNRLDSVER